MPREDELIAFIEAAKSRGASDEFVFSLLRAQGWAADAIYGAFSRYYETLTGIPVPVRRGIIEGARDAFLHLLSFGTLATWTIAAGSLLFDYVDRTFPDAVTLRTPSDYADASSLASLIVAYPVYLAVMRFILADFRRYPEKRESSIRKWLTWIALLIAASVILGDLITFIAYFLRGDITVRFVLRVLIVLLIAGGVFSYYIASLKPESEKEAG